MYKKCNIVALPSQEQLYENSIILKDNILSILPSSFMFDIELLTKKDAIVQHLYIISVEELNPSDFFIWIDNSGNKEIHQFHSDAGYGIKTYTFHNPNDDSSLLVNWSGVIGKIIATTDKSLNLPLIPVDLIKQYVDSNGSIEECYIEYEWWYRDHFNRESFIKESTNWNSQPSEEELTFYAGRLVTKLKVNANNTVSIKCSKQNFTRDEMITNLKKLAKDIEDAIMEELKSIVNENINNWTTNTWIVNWIETYL